MKRLYNKLLRAAFTTLSIVFASSYVNASIDEYSSSGSPAISAHRASFNSNDFTDFASLYVSNYGDLALSDYSGPYKLLWQFSSDGGSTWTEYSDGKKNSTNNIRPVHGGHYRCVVSRRAIATGEMSSTISNVIKVTDTKSDSKQILTNLPIIIVRTDVEDFPSGFDFMGSNENMAAAKKKISVDVKIIWDENSSDDVTNIYTDADVTNKERLYYDSKARMNYRGSSSMANAKRNYAFVVGNDSCTIKGTWVKDKKKMFNLNKSKDKDFILYASVADETYMRNMLSLDLYEDMTGEWNAHGRYVRLFVNGEDKGLYIFMEKNKVESNRIRVEEDGYVFKYDKTDIVDRASSTSGDRSTFTTDLTGKTDISTFHLWVDHAFEVVYPEWDEDDYTDEAWSAVINRLRDRITLFESALSKGDYEAVANYIDYDSWADNFIINEFTMNYDGYRISQYFKMESSDAKIKASPLWDMELGLGKRFDSYYYDKFLYQTHDVAHESDFPIPFWWDGYTRSGVHVGERYGLMDDACFKAKIRQRWQKYIASDGALSEGNILSHLNRYKEAIGIDYSAIVSWTDGRREGMKKLINNFPEYTINVELSDKKGVKPGTDVVFAAQIEGNTDDICRWYFRPSDGDEWSELQGTGKSYTIENVAASDAGFYKCVVTSKDCSCIQSEAVAQLTLDTTTGVMEPSYSDIDAKLNAYTVADLIYVENGDVANITVSYILGRVISKGSDVIKVPCKGAYIVSSGGQSLKILVK